MIFIHENPEEREAVLEKLEEHIPQIKKRLLRKEKLFFSKTKKEELNMQKEGDLHDFNGAYEEAEKIFKAALEKKIEVLLIYGMGFGYLYLAAKKWLEEKDHYLVVFEDDIEVFRHFIEIDIAREILHHPRVKIIFFEEEEILEKKIKAVCWRFVFLKSQFFSLFSYEKRKASRYQKMQDYFISYQRGIELTASYYSDQGALFFTNFYHNLLQISTAKDLDDLKGKFANIPAVVTGSGGSIKEAFSLFPEVEKKAVIFSGGSSKVILQKNQVFPSFSAYIDPHAPYDRYQQIQGYESHFLSLGFAHQNSAFLPFEKIFLANRENFPLTSWILDGLSIEVKSHELGWTTTTALIYLAWFLGFNPIFISGMDLGFEKDKYEGQIEEIEREKAEEKIFLEQDGRVFWTKKDWLEVKSWLEEFIQNHPEVEFFTLSNQGLSIKNLPYCSKEELLQKLSFHKEEDFLGKIHTILQGTTEISFNLQKVKEVLKRLQKSFDQSLFFVREELKSLEKQFSIQDFSVVNQGCIEPVYKLFLEILWEIWRHFFSRLVEEEKSEMPKEFRLKLHQLIFFENVLQNHKKILEESLESLKKIKRNL